MKQISLFGALALLLTAGPVVAGEKGMMHCFAFTPIETASPADWDAWFKESNALPKKIKSIKKVWFGKLRGNGIGQFRVDADTGKKLVAGEKDVKGTVNRMVRSWGACFLFENEAAIAAYAKNPAHDAWLKAYEKVRIAGTTTFDILGQ